MKPKLMFVVLALALAPPLALSETSNDPLANDFVTVNSTFSGITFKVWCLKAFEDNRDVEIDYSVFNGTDFPYEMIHADGMYDVEMHLTDPQGKRVTGFS